MNRRKFLISAAVATAAASVPVLAFGKEKLTTDGLGEAWTEYLPSGYPVAFFRQGNSVVGLIRNFGQDYSLGIIFPDDQSEFERRMNSLRFSLSMTHYRADLKEGLITDSFEDYQKYTDFE